MPVYDTGATGVDFTGAAGEDEETGDRDVPIGLDEDEEGAEAADSVQGTVTVTLVGLGPQPDGQGLTVLVKDSEAVHFGQYVTVVVNVAVV